MVWADGRGAGSFGELVGPARLAIGSVNAFVGIVKRYTSQIELTHLEC